MYCSNCGAELEENAKFCGNCGIVVTQNSNNKFLCPNCGNEITVGEKFCGKCGADLTNYSQPVTDTYGNNKSDDSKKKYIIIITSVILVFLIAFIVVMLFFMKNWGFEKKSDNSEPYMPVPSELVEPEYETHINISTPLPTVVPTIAPTPIPAPVFTGVKASSTRDTDYTSGTAVEYYPEYAIDGKYSTAWSADRNISLNPYITLTANTPQYVRGIRISNGYFKNETTYTRNRRITQFSIEYEGGQKTYNCGTDQYRIMQDIRFDTPVWTSYITVRVMDTYYGDWEDIAISEIEVY